MSRILVLLPSDPFALDSGARIRNAGLIELLRERHEVHTLIARAPQRSTPRRVRDIAFTGLPDMAHRLWFTDIASAVRNGR